ncbi:MAG: NUDIX domain-containing protein [archaeon]|nr:NUDIX domain-containing protein [archaeon]
MAREKSAGAVVFIKTPRGPEYLLLLYPSSAKAKNGYWDFAKGHMEKGETEQQTALREVIEETGLKDVKLKNGFRQTIQYYFTIGKKNVFKTVAFYVGETKSRNVKISYEHKGYQWLPYEAALSTVKYQNAKKILKSAHEFVGKQPRRKQKVQRIQKRG